VETAHFAFHYPAELESWTLDVATHMEAIDSAVARDVGYAPAGKTDIVVDDPYGSPNGSAWPFLNRPIVNLWATPPNPREDIGEFRDWGATLISHEFTHIAHLTRPSRNPLLRALWRAAPVDLGPIPLTAPRWVIEGYATYVEGRVTGSGRPHGVWRPAFLREWALEGQLPRYEQLDAWGAYDGGEFAYLAGSAFLEWLAQRQGDSSLVQLWRRMSARQNRTFDEAFSGVFGESARVLYGRFTTDLTENAVQARRIIRVASTPADTGSIEQRLSWETGDPALSPDGRHVAIVLRSPIARSRVVIWRTAAEPDTGKQRRDSLLLKSDPEDVPARSIYPPPKKIVAMLRSPGASYESPRFLQDGRLLLWRSTPRGDGSSSPDLYLWNPASGAVRRVTNGAAVRDADPTPDGHAAIATRCHAGWCDLVTVSLISGAVHTLIPGASTHSFYRPRIAPNGASAVVSVHDGQRWRIATVELRSGALTYLAVRDTANHYDATWGRDANEIVDVSDQGGVPNVERINLTTLQAQPATNVFGAAVAPDVNRANGTIWFLSLYSRGYDLRSVMSAQGAGAVAYLPPALTPAAPLPVEARPALGVNRVSEPRPFGLTPRQLRWIPQPQADADGLSLALGVESMDIIGRSELRLSGALGDAATWRGAALSATWNGAPPALHAQLFSAEQRLSVSRSPVPIPAALDQRLTGALISADGLRQFDRWAARYRIGATAMSASNSATRALIFGDGGVGWVQRGDQWSNAESIAGNFSSGRAFDATFSRALVGASVSTAGHSLFPVDASASYGRTDRAAPVFEQFALGGGPPAILDQAILTQRIVMPVLPSGIAVGSSVFSYRVNVTTQPVSWYFWSGSTAPAGDRFVAWHRVIGVDWSQSIGAIPLAGTPAARAQIGVGESLDAPFRRKVRAYVSLILTP
jgi:Tol biopolymer transport system component